MSNKIRLRFVGETHISNKHHSSIPNQVEKRLDFSHPIHPRAHLIRWGLKLCHDHKKKRDQPPATVVKLVVNVYFEISHKQRPTRPLLADTILDELALIVIFLT